MRKIPVWTNILPFCFFFHYFLKIYLQKGVSNYQLIHFFDFTSTQQINNDNPNNVKHK